MSIKNRTKILVKRLPILGSLAVQVWAMFHKNKIFPGSATYWQQRYDTGGNSGSGSYSRLAVYKANVINSFVEEESIDSVIEFGSGDGNQLKLARYRKYIGLDVSANAVQRCQQIFFGDESKVFRQISQYSGEKCNLALSIDVIYHLVEDDIFMEYMQRLFKAAEYFVIIYSSNDENLNHKYGGFHVRHRKFTEWVKTYAPEWKLKKCLPNLYPYIDTNPDQTSLADFYFFTKSDAF